MAAPNRQTTSQPTYDFISGGNANSPPRNKRASLRESQGPSRNDMSRNEDLRAQFNSLKYEVENLQQERKLLTLQHEKELRDLQLKAEVDFKKIQAADGNSTKISRKYDALAQELRDAQAQHVNDRVALERKVRDLQEQNQSLQEDAQEAGALVNDQERQATHRFKDVEAKRLALQETVEHLKEDLDRVVHDRDTAQAQLTQRDTEVASLEAANVKLKSRSGDGDGLAVVQRELSDQLTHIRKLESANREQLSELRRLRNDHRSVEVVQEQKRSLEARLQSSEDLSRQLGEARIQNEILEDEKRVWTSLLQREGEEAEFGSPEEMAKAFATERIERTSLVERVGRLEAELVERNELVGTLEADKTSLKQAIKAQRTNGVAASGEATDSKAFKRLDRQRALAVKEVEYLRAQLKTFDTEETVMMSNENFDSQRAEQVKQLESLVDQYRTEIQTLHSDLSTKEGASVGGPSEARGTKRSLPGTENSEDGQLGTLLRKNKNLQAALNDASTKTTLLETEFHAMKSQIKSLTSRSRTRVLELRSNPTSNHEAIKSTTLKTLQAENAGLLAQLRGENYDKVGVVPAATVDNLTLQLTRLQAEVGSAQKQTRRLREIFGSKATEFREAVASILGYKINFLPNGKARLTSLYHVKPRVEPTGGQDDEDEDEIDEEEQEANASILFDGEEGTMKFCGGHTSPFALEMKDLVRFWVDGRHSIPCFLAAMTLELFERNSKAEVGGIEAA